MTWLGKILTFVVLIVSVVWMFFSVQAYATQVKWHTAVNDFKKRLEESENYRKIELARYQANEDAIKRQYDIETKRTAGLQKELAAAQEANKKFILKVEDQQKAINDSDTKSALLQTNVDGTLKELDASRIRINQLEDKTGDLVFKAEDAKRAMVQAQNDARLARGQAEDLGKKNEELAERLNEYKQGGPGLRQQFDRPPPPVLSNLRGEVVKVNDSGALVTLSIGADAGLSVGTVLELSRLSAGKYLGTVKIIDLEAKQSTAAFTPARSNVRISQLRPEELPKKGDEVKPRSSDTLR